MNARVMLAVSVMLVTSGNAYAVCDAGKADAADCADRAAQLDRIDRNTAQHGKRDNANTRAGRSIGAQLDAIAAKRKRATEAAADKSATAPAP